MRKTFLVILSFFLLINLNAQINSAIKTKKNSENIVNEKKQILKIIEFGSFFEDGDFCNHGLEFGFLYKYNYYFYLGGVVNISTLNDQYFNYDPKIYDWSSKISPLFSLLSEFKINILKREISPTIILKLGLTYFNESGYDLTYNQYVKQRKTYISSNFSIAAGLTYFYSSKNSFFINGELLSLYFDHAVFCLGINVGATF